MTTFYRVKNWGSYQHYRDRSPPWIKLHRELLTSETWITLDDASRVLAIACMLVAAATDNKIPTNPAYIKRVAYLNGDPDFSALIGAQFIEEIDETGSVLARASKTQAKRTKRLTRDRGETETEERQRRGETEERQSSPGAALAVAPTVETWEAYRRAYHQRYGADPLRNATVNGQLAQVVRRIGAEESPAVAAFYVQHNGGYYVAQMHPVAALLKDAEKLRTEWVTGQRMTSTKARQLDKTQANGDVWGKLIAEAEDAQRAN